MHNAPSRALFLGITLAIVRCASASAGGLLQELYVDIGGNSVANLTNSFKFPDSPDSSNILLEFEAPINIGQNYGQRLRGFIIPPQTGSYTFWISSDDQSVLFLSTDESPARTSTIANVPGWTAIREWDKYDQQQSAPISLEAHRAYYVEALMKQGYGGDNLAVRWQLPDGTIEEPIPETRLIPWGIPFTIPEIEVQPADLTVVEGQPATFTVRVSNLDPVSYQWQRNRIDITNANNPSYTIPATVWSDRGARFRCRLTNSLGMIFSDEATLSLTPDVTPPTVSAIQNYGRNVLNLVFSESVETSSATSIANYYIDQGITVKSASLSPDGRTATLETSDLNYGTPYTLTVNRVRDRAAVPNTIKPDSRFVFLPSPFAPVDVGQPGLPGSSIPVNGETGLDVVGCGLGLGERSDQFQFNYQTRTGDFDVRVRVQSLELVDVWAMAGLMARQSLATNSPFTAIMATPSISGISFFSRVSTNTTTISGSFPVNYPWTWLRLKRTGNLFAGYASLDGMTWTQIGTVTNPLPAKVYFGLALTSHLAKQFVRAQFRDLAEVTAAATGDIPIDVEPLGPSSRRSGLIISEIMYHPARRADGKNLEFIELFNTQPTPEDLTGFRLAGSIDYTFPTNTILPAGSFLVVAKAPADLESVAGLPEVLGGYTNDLPNDAGTIQLLNNLGAVLLEVNYSDQPPWPAAADGAGHSLVLARPSYGEASHTAWAASQLIGGSPGRLDAICPEPLRPVVINELLTHTDAPLMDFIELYNHSNQPLDLSQAILTDDPATNKFRIPAGTIISPRGFLLFTQDQFGFNLSSAGEAIYLINPDQTCVIDAIHFGPTANGISIGRFPDGTSGLDELQTLTPGAPNSPLLVRDIVINEIMYHPISNDDADQYIELYNRGTNPVNIGYWRFIDGIDFTFPPRTVVAPGAYIVVAKNAAHLMMNYPQLNPTNTFGDFGGQLSHAGERLALARPGDPALPYQDFVLVDEVTYCGGGRWGKWSDGGGSSLELIDAHSDNRLPSNWTDSDETGMAPWTTIEATGVLDLGNDTFGVDSLQIMLMDEGECLVDNVEVIHPGRANLVLNSTFENDIAGWFAAGTHIRSGWESSESYTRSGGSLHIRASGRGATDANQVRTSLVAPLTPGPNSYTTMRAKVRWLRGNPDILLRLRGNYLEAAARMILPLNLGTPGAPNTRAALNTGPAIFAVQHKPLLPAINQPVLVTARIHDPDGLALVRLKYRVDPSTQLLSVPMSDDGTGGDTVAADGIYSALIPGQPTTNLVAFHVQAMDNSLDRVPNTFPSDAPARECLVRWGETVPPGNFGTYRFWITKATRDLWSSREPSSNDPLDATFVYGNHRVIYNMGTYYSGSPFHWTGYDSPVGRNCNYVLCFPADDPLLGTADYVLNMPANMGSDSSAQREQTFFWMVRQVGRAYAHRRFVHLFVNGLRRGTVYEDAQQPSREYIKQWYPNDAEGELYKIEDWFEYHDNNRSFVNTDATLDDFRSADGTRKQARYRWNWRKRALRGSAHDYANLFALVDALNTTDSQTYASQVEALVDVDQWMSTFALRHIVGDWDAYGYRRGKNMYAYKPQHGKWQLLDWDISFDYGLGDGPTHSLFDVAHFDGTIDRVTERMYNHPQFRRAYLRAVQDAADGPMLASRVGPVLDAKYAGLVANGFKVGRPDSIKSWIERRRTNLVAVLATNAARFAITSNGGADFTISDRNLLLLKGTAPVGIKTLKINGVAYPPTWTSVTDWTIRLALRSGVNRLTLQGFNSYGALDPSATAKINVTFTGPDEQPQDHLVINEIMYHPASPDTGYVEIYNNSASYAFDLSGFELRGTAFTFPEGTVISPGEYLVVVNNYTAFIAAYGHHVPIAGVFNGRLRNDGETLSLVKPGPAPGQDLVINQVSYSDQPPWPTPADGQGPSLQLIDPNQDNRRVANWTAVGGTGPGSGWKFASVTGTAKSNSLYVYLGSSGDVYLDDLWLASGAAPEVEPNLVYNGDFESPLTSSWAVSPDDPLTETTTAVKHKGQASLHMVSTYGGLSLLPSISQTTAPVRPGQTYTLSFWYLPSQTGGGLTVGLLDSDIQKTVSIVPGEVVLAPATPGAPNSVRADLGPFPPIWINEIQPINISGRADRTGRKGPWVELVNTGTAPVGLAGCYLADNPTNLLQWPFPATATIPASGFLLVWADGNPNLSDPTELHTSFRLDQSSGSVALVQTLNNQTRVLDYLSYELVPADRSLGSYPDADPNARRILYFATPGAPNNPAAAPVKVLINEWMASNQSTIPDPADNDFADWFEIFNPNDLPVDLSGYTLTDDLSRADQWTIPAKTIIPARGFLLVWADNQPNQTGPDTGLHANFRLNQDGESIGLFAPDRTQIDAVSFGPQTADVSEGRFPDGAPQPFVAMHAPTPGAPNIPPTPQPRAVGLTLSFNGLAITWSVEPGKQYQMQYKDNLDDPLWHPLGNAQIPPGPTLSITDTSLLTEPQRYYRLLQLP
jgi:hypothetical protein